MAIAAKTAAVKSGAKEKLVEAALTVFSRSGFEGASTRDIAAAAGVNHAAIAYYFSGKEALYAACIDAIIATGHAEIGPMMQQLNVGARGRLTEAQGWTLLDLFIETMTPFILDCRERLEASRIVMREMADPTQAFDRLYDGMMRDLHESLTRILACLTGRRPGNRRLILCAHAVLGQITIFKHGHAVIARRLGVDALSDKAAREIIDVIKINTRGIVAAWRTEGSKEAA